MRIPLIFRGMAVNAFKSTKEFVCTINTSAITSGAVSFATDSLLHLLWLAKDKQRQMESAVVEQGDNLRHKVMHNATVVKGRDYLRSFTGCASESALMLSDRLHTLSEQYLCHTIIADDPESAHLQRVQKCADINESTSTGIGTGTAATSSHHSNSSNAVNDPHTESSGVINDYNRHIWHIILLRYSMASLTWKQRQLLKETSDQFNEFGVPTTYQKDTAGSVQPSSLASTSCSSSSPSSSSKCSIDLDLSPVGSKSMIATHMERAVQLESNIHESMVCKKFSFILVSSIFRCHAS